ncbi:MAG TPA: glycosyl hydrolase family 28-related protein, partial [Pirellulales bacterium]|nr:glycosyl hydrolase family 28-related protein [Pirellulales bacterium]
MRAAQCCLKLVLALVLLLAGARGARAWSDEEFIGPFDSWADLKRDFHAVGDGKADDTQALQAALDRLNTHRIGPVLYIPSGTYRITSAVTTRRTAHTTGMGVSIIGEDPATTTLLWDGPQGGT